MNIELGSAIVQVVHIAAKAIAVDAAIAVHGAAGITHCLGPVVAGVAGILTGGTIQNNTFCGNALLKFLVCVAFLALALSIKAC